MTWKHPGPCALKWLLPVLARKQSRERETTVFEEKPTSYPHFCAANSATQMPWWLLVMGKAQLFDLTQLIFRMSQLSTLVAHWTNGFGLQESHGWSSLPKD